MKLKDFEKWTDGEEIDIEYNIPDAIPPSKFVTKGYQYTTGLGDLISAYLKHSKIPW